MPRTQASNKKTSAKSTGRRGKIQVCYDCLRPRDLAKRRKAFPVAYLPLGTLEWHGVQNPLGLDGRKAHALAIRCAEEGGGVVFPTLFYGEPRKTFLLEVDHDTDGKAAEIQGLSSERFSPDLLGSGDPLEEIHFFDRLLWRIFHQVFALGFEALIVICGHYPLGRNANTVAEILRRKKGWQIWTGIECDVLKPADQEPGEPAGDHAGLWETSLMMALEPGLIDLEELPKAKKAKLTGIFGQDPRAASRALGRKWIGRMVKRYVELANELLRRARESRGTD